MNLRGIHQMEDAAAWDTLRISYNQDYTGVKSDEKHVRVGFFVFHSFHLSSV
jgi:hypothetical protein